MERRGSSLIAKVSGLVYKNSAGTNPEDQDNKKCRVLCCHGSDKFNFQHMTVPRMPYVMD